MQQLVKTVSAQTSTEFAFFHKHQQQKHQQQQQHQRQQQQQQQQQQQVKLVPSCHLYNLIQSMRCRESRVGFAAIVRIRCVILIRSVHTEILIEKSDTTSRVCFILNWLI